MYLSTYSQSPAQTTKFKPNQKLFDRTYSNLTSIFLLKKVLKYLNNFLNRNFSVLWLKWTQTIEMKQNQTFFHRTYSNLISIFIGSKILKFSMTFIIDIFQCHCKIYRKEVKWNKIKQDMCKSDSIFPNLQSITVFE